MVDVAQTQSPERPPIDAVLEREEYTRDGKPIRIRVQPDLYNHDKMQNDSWPQAIWQFEMKDAAAASRFRVALTRYFKLLGELGTERMAAELDQIELNAQQPVQP